MGSRDTTVLSPRSTVRRACAKRATGRGRRSWRSSRRRTSCRGGRCGGWRARARRAAPRRRVGICLLDEYLDADLAARCKQRYESYLLKRDGPRDLPAVTKEAKEPNLGDRARDVWLNVREFPVDLGRGLRERFSRDDDDGGDDADDEPDAAALLEEAAAAPRRGGRRGGGLLFSSSGDLLIRGVYQLRESRYGAQRLVTRFCGGPPGKARIA